VTAVSAPHPTTALVAPRLAERLGVELTLVSETFQETGSFKFRAAWSVVCSVPQDLLLTVSSGNYGQALARAAQLAGKRAIVAMPAGSAAVKVAAVRHWGARVELLDPARESRAAGLARLALEYPEAYVSSPYDDPLVIAGNASLGREIAALDIVVDAVIAPVGGGGLSAGIAVGLKESHRRIALWGAEPLVANDAARSLRSGQLEQNDPAAGEPATIADGARTPSLGQHNWRILRDSLAGIVEVPENALREAVRLLFIEANLKVEPTGALPVAALLVEPAFRGQRVVAVISGGNVDPSFFCELLTGPAAPPPQGQSGGSRRG
jgi:threonine dehydratase